MLTSVYTILEVVTGEYDVIIKHDDAQQHLCDDESVQNRRSDLRSGQLKLPKQARRAKPGCRLREPREKRLLLLPLLLFLFAAMMNNVPCAWPLCSSFVLCLVLIWLRNTERDGRAGSRPLYAQPVQVSKTYIAVFNITHVLSIKGPRRYAIESIGLAVGTIRSSDWHVAGQLARRMHKAANPDIFPPCPDQSSPPEYPA